MMRHRIKISPLHPDPRRGSVYLIVFVILLVLALMSMTLSYTAKVELDSARNWAEGIQARISATTGAPRFQGRSSLPNQFASSPILVGRAQPARTRGGTVPKSHAIGNAKSTSPRGRSGVISTRSSMSSVSKPIAAFALAEGNELVMLNLKIDMNSRSRHRPSSSREKSMQSVGNEPTGRDQEEKENELERERQFEFNGPLGFSRIEDESAKFNINAILPTPKRISQAPSPRKLRPRKNLNAPITLQLPAVAPLPAPDASHLALFIARTLEAKHVKLKTSPRQLAEAIVHHRYGPDEYPGVRGMDDNGNSGRDNPGADGLDNDRDHVIDNPEEQAFSTQLDGLDNNHNGVIDEPGESIETDGLDNDYDGQVDESGEGVDDPAEYSPDPRLPPFGDDRVYRRVSDLKTVPGMTAEAYAALEPHLTVFSVSRPAYPENANSIMGLMQLDPNTAQPEEIYKMLRERFPRLPRDLIGQFAVNIVDRRDADDVPTEARLGPERTSYFGYEITPSINEVCPVTATLPEDGDDGQFVEIANPNSQPIKLDGWKLESRSITVRLSGILPPGGLMVVTDDYNNASDPDGEEERGTGSLYDLFGVVRGGMRQRVIEDPKFDLADKAGTVNLYNPEGQLIDTFVYSGASYTGAGLSFQRIDPRLKTHRRDYATPLGKNRGASETAPEDREFAETVEQMHNRPFQSPLELMLMPTAYIESNEDALGATATQSEKSQIAAHARWRYPGFRSAESDNLDVRIVDLFMPGAPARHMGQLFALTNLDSASNQKPEQRRATRRERRWRAQRDAPAPLYGRININTAPPAVLAALPGLDHELAYRIALLRNNLLETNAGERQRVLNDIPNLQGISMSKAWYQAASPQLPTRWKTLSDLLEDSELWRERGLNERIETVYPFSRMITFQSLSFKVTTENYSDPTDEDGKRRPSAMKVTRIIAADRGRIETVAFDYGASDRYYENDPNLRYGSEPDPNYDLSVGVLDQARVKRAKEKAEAEAKAPRANEGK